LTHLGLGSLCDLAWLCDASPAAALGPPAKRGPLGLNLRAGYIGQTKWHSLATVVGSHHQNHPIFSISDVLNANHRICHVPWEHVKSDCHQAWILLQTLTSEESEGDSEDMKFIYNINIKTDMEVS